MKDILSDLRKDLELLEKANLDRTGEFSAMMEITALHTLRRMSEALGVPMDKLTAEHIIHARQDKEMQAETRAIKKQRPKE
jgi:diphthamide synthase (EF-2-diphthine--ammonia ligase)